METNTNIPVGAQFIPTILHDFIKKVVVLRPAINIREEISYDDHKHYLGFDLLKEN